MAGLDEAGRTILRNRLLGRWAAGKLGLSGTEAEDYSKAFAAAATDPAGSDVFGRIRSDFDAAGIAVTDDQILGALTELTIKAGGSPAGTGGLADGAAFALKRNLTG
jgi:hypothetical protein